MPDNLKEIKPGEKRATISDLMQMENVRINPDGSISSVPAAKKVFDVSAVKELGDNY